MINQNMVNIFQFLVHPGHCHHYFISCWICDSLSYWIIMHLCWQSGPQATTATATVKPGGDRISGSGQSQQQGHYLVGRDWFGANPKCVAILWSTFWTALHLVQVM